MNKTLHIDAFKKHFKDWPQFKVADIQAFYHRQGEDLKRSTLDWRIHELKKLGVIQNVGRGLYSLDSKMPFSPEVDQKLKQLYNRLKRHFPFLTLCIWNTRWLNALMVHQPMHFYTLLEVEKDGLESVFYFIQENTNKPVLIDPSASFLEKYGARNQEQIIVKPLISEAPIQKVEKIMVPTLEKILVDLYCEGNLFAAQQGTEIGNVFMNAFERYRIDEPKLLRYAARRKKREALENLIQNIKEKALFSNSAKS